MEMQHPGGKLFGVGINTNIVAASLRGGRFRQPTAYAATLNSAGTTQKDGPKGPSLSRVHLSKRRDFAALSRAVNN